MTKSMKIFALILAGAFMQGSLASSENRNSQGNEYTLEKIYDVGMGVMAGMAVSGAAVGITGMAADSSSTALAGAAVSGLSFFVGKGVERYRCYKLMSQKASKGL